MPLGDKRLFSRFPAKPGSYVSFQEGSATVLDVSLTGVFISDPKPFPEGTTFEFDLNLIDLTLHAKGRVCESIAGKGMGVRFLDLPPATSTRLERYLNILAGSPSG